jgi:hypothetical protein
LHAQFDYLKNTVSVYNDYLQTFSNYQVTAEVYDLNSKKISTQTIKIPSIPEDAVLNNLIKLDFSKAITSVQFIRLILADEKGKMVANSFYWRSNDAYLGKKTMTGPATAGFEPLATMKKVSLQTKVSINKKDKWNSIELDIKNPSKEIAFFTQIQLLDGNDKPIRPSFYTDNFFSLMPGETKHISIETSEENLIHGNPKIVVKGYNVIPEQSIIAKQM